MVVYSITGFRNEYYSLSNGYYKDVVIHEIS